VHIDTCTCQHIAIYGIQNRTFKDGCSVLAFYRQRSKAEKKDKEDLIHLFFETLLQI
jgi:hypothetical protein